jgi:hypothetical protein
MLKRRLRKCGDEEVGRKASKRSGAAFEGEEKPGTLNIVNQQGSYANHTGYINPLPERAEHIVALKLTAASRLSTLGKVPTVQAGRYLGY